MKPKREYYPPETFLLMVDDSLATAIGHVVAQWSILEMTIEASIWQAARLRNDLGRAVTSETQLQGKMDLLLALLYQTQPKLAERFAPITDYIRSCLIGKRNLVVHGWWTAPLGIKTPYVVKFRAQGRLISRSGEMTLEELKQLALDIAAVSCWVHVLAGELPKLRQRRGGLAHQSPDIQDPLQCAKKKQRALLPLSSPLTIETPKKKQQQERRKRRPVAS